MTKLVFVDTETTGLDVRVHDAYEVSLWPEDDRDPSTTVLPHSLDFADPFALGVGRYVERQFTPLRTEDVPLHWIRRVLTGATLVGSNPDFDARHLRKLVGYEPWNHRKINVAEGAMWLFGWDRPRGLAAVVEHLGSIGYNQIPQPNHTAEGDVRATRAVYECLRGLRGAERPGSRG